MTDGARIVRPKKRRGRVEALFRTAGDGFQTVGCDHLDLSFGGIDGDRHGGTTRRTGGREPWYARGTEIRNERQLTLLAVDELAAIAADLKIAELRPEWIGGNMLVSGIERLTFVPPRTRLVFSGGACLRVDGDNAPCRAAGRAIAKRHEGRGDLELGFVKAADRRRGLVAWVERPGRVEAGEAFEARIPEQWIYED